MVESLDLLIYIRLQDTFPVQMFVFVIPSFVAVSFISVICFPRIYHSICSFPTAHASALKSSLCLVFLQCRPSS